MMSMQAGIDCQLGFNILCSSVRILDCIIYSQDHIELLLGLLIRSKGGFNPNPNAIQLMRAYKRVFTHIQCSQSGRGNW
jgi:hypothetical protein